MNNINILSLFDGVSCGQLALNRAGIKYDQYYASEINKHAIKVTSTNFPNTIQLGDVTKVEAKNLPKIDILIGGSPCTGFSPAGKLKNFNDPQSKLFFEYVRLLKECQPKYFLLENVKMKQEYQDVISDILKVKPIFINSSLFSSQSRQRLYWSNIPNIIVNQKNSSTIQDILEPNVDPKYYLTNNYTSKTVMTGESRLDVLKKNYRKIHKIHSDKPVLVSQILDIPTQVSKVKSKQLDRLYSSKSKSPTLTVLSADGLKIDCGTDDPTKWRTLTPVECERLQTIQDNYTSCISDSQRYKCLGNCWTVDVVAHILSFIPR
jgi:DNA-cytosine methyltransferase